MFKYFEESRLLWFNSDSFESDSEFELIGILLGVAIYNAIIVDFQMPKCIYRKLMGMKCSLEDLRELQVQDCGEATLYSFVLCSYL